MPPPAPANRAANSGGNGGNVYQQTATSVCGICGKRAASTELSYTANEDLACAACASQALAPREEVCSVCGFSYPPESMISRGGGLVCPACAAPKSPAMRLVNAPKKKRSGGSWLTRPITFGAGGSGLLVVIFIVIRVVVYWNRAHPAPDPQRMTVEERNQINENLRQAEERQRQRLNP